MVVSVFFSPLGFLSSNSTLASYIHTIMTIQALFCKLRTCSHVFGRPPWLPLWSPPINILACFMFHCWVLFLFCFLKSNINHLSAFRPVWGCHQCSEVVKCFDGCCQSTVKSRVSGSHSNSLQKGYAEWERECGRKRRKKQQCRKKKRQMLIAWPTSHRRRHLGLSPPWVTHIRV